MTFLSPLSVSVPLPCCTECMTKAPNSHASAEAQCRLQPCHAPSPACGGELDSTDSSPTRRRTTGAWGATFPETTIATCGTARGLPLVARVAGRIDFKPIPGTNLEMEVDLVLLAMGFLGPERNGMLNQLGVKLTERGNVWRDENWMTSVPGVFTAGDMQRGQSLIVWAIAEGRSAARGLDLYLMGRSDLPAPLS